MKKQDAEEFIYCNCNRGDFEEVIEYTDDSSSEKPNNSSEKFTSSIDKHQSICDFLHETYERKNHDYGDSFGKTFRELGLISAITRISDKHNRLITLATKGGQKVKDESIKDTLLDMANYCIMTVMELDKEKENG